MEAHSELDMIRDECPGTAAGLKDACYDHIGIALGRYNRMNDEKKIRLHNQKMTELEGYLEHNKIALERTFADYNLAKEAWKDYQKNPSKHLVATKTRADQLRRLMGPYRIELEMEEAAEEYDRLKTAKIRTTRLLNREKMFTLN